MHFHSRHVQLIAGNVLLTPFDWLLAKTASRNVIALNSATTSAGKQRTW